MYAQIGQRKSWSNNTCKQVANSRKSCNMNQLPCANLRIIFSIRTSSVTLHKESSAQI